MRRLLEVVKRNVVNDVLSVIDAFAQNDRARLTVERADGAAQFCALLSSNADGKNSKGAYLILRILRTLCRSPINIKSMALTQWCCSDSVCSPPPDERLPHCAAGLRAYRRS